MAFDDNELRASVIVDTSGLQKLSGGVETTTQAIARMNAAFIEQGLSADEASQALVSLGFKADAVAKSLGQVSVSSGSATSAMTGLDRAMQTAGTRLAVTELNLGRMGLALGRVGLAAGVLGPIMSAAFPVIALVGAIDLIDSVAERIAKMKDRVVDADLEWNKIDHSIITFGDHLSKSLADADVKLEHFSKIGLGEFDDGIRKATVDTDLLFNHISSVLSQFDAMQSKTGKGYLMQFLTGEGGIGEVQSAAKKAQDAIEQALNVGDTAGAQTAVAKALDAIVVRENELKQISGSQDRLKAYQQLYDVLSRYNVALSQSVELAKKENEVSAAQSFDALKKDTHAQGMAASREMAQEELAGIERNAAETKKLHEEGMRASHEMAEEELTEIQRVAEAKKKAATDEANADLRSLEMIEKRGQTEVNVARESTALIISEDEKRGDLGGAKSAATSGFVTEKAMLEGLIEAEGKYQQAIAASGLEQEKKDQLTEASMVRVQGLNDQILQSLQKTSKALQDIRDKDPWKVMADELGRTTQLITLQTGVAQNFTNQLNTGVGNALSQWIVSGKNFGRTMEETFAHILASEASFVVEWLLKKAELWAMDATIGKAPQAAAALSSVTSNAAVAASGAAASVASIPLVGWAMAPEIAAETFASTMAYASMIAFEKGGIVGRTGPALVHQGEAVLPRNLTTMLQGAAGKGNAGRSININYSPHISAIDTRGMTDVLREHSDLIAASVTDALRRRNM